MDNQEQIQRNKEALRREAKAWRDAQAPQWIQEQSLYVLEQVEAIPVFREVEQVLSYVDCPGEVATRPLIQKLLEAGREVLVPVMTGPGQMQWSRLESLARLTENRYGILEPESPIWVEPKQQSCALVPGLLFFEDGHRLGYGAGFYDRFLSEYEGASIGLCFAEQLHPPIPMGKYDLPAGVIATQNSRIIIK